MMAAWSLYLGDVSGIDAYAETTREQAVPQFMTIRQVARTGLLPEWTIRIMVKQGKVPGFYSGNKFLVNITKFIQQLEAL